MHGLSLPMPTRKSFFPVPNSNKNNNNNFAHSMTCRPRSQATRGEGSFYDSPSPSRIPCLQSLTPCFAADASVKYFTTQRIARPRSDGVEPGAPGGRTPGGRTPGGLVCPGRPSALHSCGPAAEASGDHRRRPRRSAAIGGGEGRVS